MIRENVRIGLASSRGSALQKIRRLSADSGVPYCVHIFGRDGRMEKKTIGFSQREPSTKMEIRPHAFSEAVAGSPLRIPGGAEAGARIDDADAGIAMRERIALLAYSYWEKRGCQGGSPEQDWLRAERELLGRLHDRSRTMP